MRTIAAILLSVFAGAAAGEDPALAWTEYRSSGTSAPPRTGFPHGHCFRRAALTTGVPLTLLLAVARGESDFDVTARSHAGAHGLMQILWPGTAQHLGVYRLAELYDPCTNVDAGARYLAELSDRYDGDLHLTLAAYNYGPQRIAVGATQIPNGARWYSAYILRHLRYVTGGAQGARDAAPYLAAGKRELTRFAMPYRAEAFVESLQRASPELQLDWFRTPDGAFAVTVSYGDADEQRRAEQLLALAGFPVD